jgi:2-polyprenyl-3-methyl-5-hydroxy-6-metoxy-1,4-benzoquinol methylase
MVVLEREAHWDAVYRCKGQTGVSWYQQTPRICLELIDSVAGRGARRIIDVGGGASVLADRLLERDFSHVAVLDVSTTAMECAKRRLGSRASAVQWIAADLLTVDSLGEYDIWHDRAVFHFLTAPEERQRYVELASRTIAPGGHLIIGTFSDNGPTKCSGLEVCRYDACSLAAEFGDAFTLVREAKETHITPAGVGQEFVFGLFRSRRTGPPEFW